MKPYRLPFLILAFLFSPDVHGQNAADIELAKRHYELGKTYYNQAAYDQALDAFQEGYKLSKKPELLYNIGKCHEAMGNIAKAIEHYRRFLKETGRGDSNVEARIKNLERRLEAQKTATTDPKPADPAPQPSPTPTPTPQPQPPPTKSGPRWMTITGWSLVGLGVVALGTGIAMGALASARASDVEEAYKENTHDWADIKAKEDKGKAFNVGMIVGISVGILAAGGGATLLFLDSRRESRTAGLDISPFCDGETVGATAVWRY